MTKHPTLSLDYRVRVSVDTITGLNAEFLHGIRSGCRVLHHCGFPRLCAFLHRCYIPSGSILPFGASSDESVMTKPSEMELVAAVSRWLHMWRHCLSPPLWRCISVVFLAVHLTVAVWWDLTWPNVLEMCCKFLCGLLQCRDRDINIAANHTFTRDFSHSRGPRRKKHLDWIADVTGKWIWSVWSDFGLVGLEVIWEKVHEFVTYYINVLRHRPCSSRNLRRFLKMYLITGIWHVWIQIIAQPSSQTSVTVCEGIRCSSHLVYWSERCSLITGIS